MNARSALAAVAALAFGACTFAGEQQTVELGSFVNTGPGSALYTGPYVSHVTTQAVNGHNIISVDLDGILESLGYDAVWSITITDNGANAYGSLSPGADIDLFRIDGVNAQPIYSYFGPSTVHSFETADRLAERSLAADSFSGAQDAWHITHVSLGMEGTVTASWAQPLDLREFIGDPGDGDDGDDEGPPDLGGDFVGYNPPGPGNSGIGGDAPLLLLSEHGTFESFRVSVVAGTIPAPGALALLALAGLVGKSRRRR